MMRYMQYPSVEYTLKLILLAALYFVSGKLGLLLAVPPGYATIIWPASGIATGMLLVYGYRLWPGILVGSFILNCHISSAFSVESGFDIMKTVVAAGIAAGSTLQALLARFIVSRFIGLPLSFNRIREMGALLLLTGPLACVTAASIGAGSLHFAGIMPAEKLAENWITWWMGDTFGVIVFMPLVLLVASGEREIKWQGSAIGKLPLLAVITLIVPLGLTFYAWKVASEGVYQTTLSRFNTLAVESKNALELHMNSYNYALLGSIGFIDGSDYVSRDEWKTYIRSLDIEKNFPGINGFGVISVVAAKDISSFEKTEHTNQFPSFTVHPPVPGGPYYIIKYIEPQDDNVAAVGLNVAFEENRKAAVELARDTGKPAITGRIALVQDTLKRPGFLLMYPRYKHGAPTATIEQRRAAFDSLVYAPFVADKFFKDLTASQGKTIHLHVYDGDVPSLDNLIFSDEKMENRATRKPSSFVVRQKINTMQRIWTLEWESSTAFEAENHSNIPAYTLAGGLLFTGLLALFLLQSTVRNADIFERIAGRKYAAFPLAVFVILVASTLALYQHLSHSTHEQARAAVREEAKKIERIISTDINAKILALRRMAQRWEAAHGVTEKLWHPDARHYINDLRGLRAVEWIDPTYHVRLVEPLEGNEKALGLNILSDPVRKKALEGVAESANVILTPPLDLVQGYKGMVIYAPIRIEDKFGGLIAGIFSVDEFFKQLIFDETDNDFDVDLTYDNKSIFKIDTPADNANDLTLTRFMTIQGGKMGLRIIPTKAFVNQINADVQNIVLFLGLLISSLVSLLVRYALVARVKSLRLEQSNELNKGILSGASYLIISTDINGTVTSFNKASEIALGYKADEIIGKHTPAIWHDMGEIAQRAEELSAELGRKIAPGFRVFVTKPEIQGSETHGWTFIRKDGSRFPVSLTATALRTSSGQITGYLGVIADITDRIALDRTRERLSLATNAAQIGIWDWDIAPNTLYWTYAMFVLYGIDENKDKDKETLVTYNTW